MQASSVNQRFLFPLGTTVALTDSKKAEKGLGRGLFSLSLVNGLPGVVSIQSLKFYRVYAVFFFFLC